MTDGYPDDLVAVGRVLRPQGNKGQVRVLPMTRLERFDELGTVTAWKDGRGRSLTLTGCRAMKELAVLAFAEVGSIDEAESLRQAILCIPASERAVLPEGSFYHDDLFGLDVMTEDGRHVGVIVSIVSTGVNDVFAVRDEGGRESFIPALRSIVMRVDLESGSMMIKAPPGLLDR